MSTGISQAITALTALAPTRKTNAKYVKSLSVPVSKRYVDAFFDLVHGRLPIEVVWNPTFNKQTLNWTIRRGSTMAGFSVVLEHGAHLNLCRGVPVELHENLSLQLTPAELIPEPTFAGDTITLQWEWLFGPKFTGKWGWARTTIEVDRIEITRTGATAYFRGWKGWIARKLVNPTIEFVEPDDVAKTRFEPAMSVVRDRRIDRGTPDRSAAEYIIQCREQGIAPHPDGADKAVRSALLFGVISIIVQSIVNRLLDRYFGDQVER